MNKKSRNLIINCCVAAIIYIVVRNLPPPAPITAMGMELLAIVLMMIYGLITIGIVLPSLAALVLAGFSGYFGPGVQFAVMAAFGNYVACLVITLMLFAGVLNASGLGKVLAEKIVYSKLANGRPWVLTALIMIASWLPSMFMTAMPVVFIMFNILNGICELVGYKKGEKWPKVMYIMVTFCALIGMTCMPFNVGVAGDFAILLSIDATQVVPTGLFIISSLTLAIVMMTITFLVIRFLIKPDVSNLENYTSKYEVKFETDHKRAICLLALLVILVVLPDALPDGAAKNFFSNFGAAGASLLVVFIACAIRNKDGSEFLNFEDIAKAGMYWPMLIMIAAINSICSALSSSDIGIVAFLQQTLEPLVQGLSPFTFFVLFVVIAYITTNILDGAVVAYVTIPIMYVISPMVGLTATGMMAVMTHNVQSGLALPSASPSAGIMFGLANDDFWYTKKDAYKLGSLCALIYLASMLLVYYPFVKMM